MTYTDTQLKQALARLNSDIISSQENKDGTVTLFWLPDIGEDLDKVKDTELLHFCWLVEETVICNNDKYENYISALYAQNENVYHSDCHATWQQRTIALCKVKGITI